MFRLPTAALWAAWFTAAAWAQTNPSGTIPPPPPASNGYPPALEIPRLPPPTPPAGASPEPVDQRAATVFDCERLERARQPLPLDCRGRPPGR